MSPHETPQTEKWTEIEHLPEWDEEFYYVYTAKKYGKWLMLKTLRPEYRDKPEYQSMIDKEFDVRYNLAHPHIVMINDYEEVPGLGRCIITDDIYGDSLRKLIDSSRVSDATIDKLTHDLVDALEYIQTNHLVHHPIRPETIIFTENIGNLKLINVGFDQKNSLSPDATADDIFNFGLILTEALKANPKYPDASRLRKIAARCLSPNPAGRFPDIRALKMAIDGRAKIATIVLTTVFIVLMVGVLAWLVGKG
ncbi:MAG: hypothetical protein HDS75_01795 [Bacteroidales bacterium]|nr:hypothetical protein [Bacteroidales bacterium]